MKIAVIGWGSLCWDPRSLNLAGGWETDGPSLPLEFARASSDPERLTLVICPPRTVLPEPTPVRALWAESGETELEDAVCNLAQREKCRVRIIGRCKADKPPPEEMIEASIARWLRQKPGLDAAIWTGLRPNLPKGGSGPLTQQTVVEYIEDLKGRGFAEPSFAYVRNAPAQIQTPFRASIETALGLGRSPSAAPPPEGVTFPPGSTARSAEAPLITTTSDLRWEEWKECRTTIGRMDTALEDLRKFGFSLVTGLVTASALFGASRASRGEALTAAAVVIMVLIGALFGLDGYYVTILAGARKRAVDIEMQTKPPAQLTDQVSHVVERAHSLEAALVAYLAFLTSAAGIGALGFHHTGLQTGIAVFAFVVAGTAMIRYWGVIRKTTSV